MPETQEQNLALLFEKVEPAEQPVSEASDKVVVEDISRKLKLLDVNFREEELESRKQDREQRRRFARDIFWVVVAYLVIVLTVVFFDGFELTNISDTVLVTLLGTTTANVIALLMIVVKYLFHTK